MKATDIEMRDDGLYVCDEEKGWQRVDQSLFLRIVDQRDRGWAEVKRLQNLLLRVLPPIAAPKPDETEPPKLDLNRWLWPDEIELWKAQPDEHPEKWTVRLILCRVAHDRMESAKLLAQLQSLAERTAWFVPAPENLTNLPIDPAILAPAPAASDEGR
jgi:hypothetical protein